MDDKLKEIVRKWALDNARKYDGKASLGAVISKTIGEVPDVKAKLKTLSKDIKKIVLDRYTRLRRQELDRLGDLAFRVVLGAAPESYTKTTPQHVRAARMLKEKGIELKAGDLISFVKVVKDPHVKPVELATDSEVDVDKYVAYLQSTFDQVLDALGLDFEEIIGLTKLERFM